jgi:hypothetical protein
VATAGSRGGQGPLLFQKEEPEETNERLLLQLQGRNLEGWQTWWDLPGQSVAHANVVEQFFEFCSNADIKISTILY